MARGITNFTISVDPLLSGTDREIVGQLIIERIQDRTEAGQNIDGERFQRYSPGYTSYLQRIGAATGVDLTLTGEMLNSISILSHSQGSITIGLEAGTEAGEKARWNQGGNPRIKNRPFMGIRDSEANVIEVDVAANSPAVAAQRFLNESNVISRIFENITLGN